MSRNMIEVNQAIFAALDDYCASHDQNLINAGSPRWIETRASDRRFIKAAKKIDGFSLGPSRSIFRFDLDGSAYFICQGFTKEIEVGGVVFGGPTAGQAATLVFEARPRPSSDISIIRQFVEFSDKHSEPSYTGHPFSEFLNVFPQQSVGRFTGLDAEETWHHFFLISLCEIQGSSWISDRLIAILRTVCDLDPAKIPYKTLCRSIFDTDPAALFLALYRCLEALYAYDSAKRVGNILAPGRDWSEIAVALEDEIGWHPREEGSLEKLMRMAELYDLCGVCQALAVPEIPEDRLGLSRASSKVIYKTRNALVHYRPSHHKLDISSLNWNSACEFMASIVLSVYFAVFLGEST